MSPSHNCPKIEPSDYTNIDMQGHCAEAPANRHRQKILPIDAVVLIVLSLDVPKVLVTEGELFSVQDLEVLVFPSLCKRRCKFTCLKLE